MAARTVKGRNGHVVRDGAKMTLVLLKGDARETHPGRVRALDVTFTGQRDEHGNAPTWTEERWEIETGDPQWPAIGFLPEHVESAE